MAGPEATRSSSQPLTGGGIDRQVTFRARSD
jgi:hypothetical protein